jgi:hypothetical protein
VIAAAAGALARLRDWAYLEGMFGERRPDPPVDRFIQMVADGFANLHAAGTARDS